MGLEALLRAAKIPSPYVLVGTSHPGHGVEAQDPQLVIDAILEVVKAAR